MKRIKQISIKNLFGMFDHTISLNLDERITIIHGPNGFGKTAILRLLNDVFSKSNSALQTLPFEEFYVQFDDDTFLQMRRITDDHFFPLTPSVTVRFSDGLQEEALNFPPALRRRDADTMYVANSDKTPLIWSPNKSTQIVRDTNGAQWLVGFRDTTLEKTSEWLKGMRQSVSVRLIETQRLLNPEKLRENEPVMVPTVNTYSQELAEIIKEKLAESTTLSQSLDRTFPSRLVSPTMQQKSVVASDLRERLIELEQKRQYLTATGLLDQEGADSIQVQEQDQIDESTKIVLSVYAEDTEKKLGVFDELANKIDLLKRIINKRFLYKEMTISKEQGFVFTNAKGIVLSPGDLSSGEQHELILFYELLFKVAPGSLILIDEPEISLHVIWQEQFLEDVQAVTRLSNIDVLLATHSPDIIADSRDLMVELKGPM